MKTVEQMADTKARLYALTTPVEAPRPVVEVAPAAITTPELDLVANAIFAAKEAAAEIQPY